MAANLKVDPKIWRSRRRKNRPDRDDYPTGQTLRFGWSHCSSKYNRDSVNLNVVIGHGNGSRSIVPLWTVPCSQFLTQYSHSNLPDGVYSKILLSDIASRDHVTPDADSRKPPNFKWTSVHPFNYGLSPACDNSSIRIRYLSSNFHNCLTFKKRHVAT